LPGWGYSHHLCRAGGSARCALGCGP
jgi:hypothetical protein